MKKIITVSLSLFAFVGFTNVAFATPTAYIDPNTGGMIFQFLAVAFTLLSGVIFFFSSRIKMAFARLARLVREKTGKATTSGVTSENHS